MTSVPRPGASSSSATAPSRMRKKRSAGVALAKEVARRPRSARCAPHPAISCELRRREAGEQRRGRDQLLKRLHRRCPSLSRIARASSVMSMPTGHQVMQRPQPTQPELPNWSIQVASLWVIHWR